jgi:hypothetical protein
MGVCALLLWRIIHINLVIHNSLRYFIFVYNARSIVGWGAIDTQILFLARGIKQHIQTGK